MHTINLIIACVCRWRLRRALDRLTTEERRVILDLAQMWACSEPRCWRFGECCKYARVIGGGGKEGCGGTAKTTQLLRQSVEQLNI